MKRSRPGGAARPDDVPARSSSAGGHPNQAEQVSKALRSIADVQRWLKKSVAAHIIEAVAVLSKQQNPRRLDVRPLLNKWHVAQKKNQRDRPLPDIIQELKEKVITAAQELQQQLADSAGRPASHAGTEVRAAHPPAGDCAKQLLECGEWLDSLPEQVVSESRLLQRARSAAALLQKPTSSRQRQELQPILAEWGVLQKRYSSGKRKFDDVKLELVSRVIEETARLKTMHDAPELRVCRGALTSRACVAGRAGRRPRAWG